MAEVEHKKLERLNVDDDFLDQAALATLPAAFTCEVVSASQNEIENDDPERRYVSVSE